MSSKAKRGYILRVNSRNAKVKKMFVSAFYLNKNFSVLVFRCLPIHQTGTDSISILVCCCCFLVSSSVSLSFLGLRVIKFESSSSLLHVHTLYENFYRIKAIRAGNMLQLTRNVEKEGEKLLKQEAEAATALN